MRKIYPGFFYCLFLLFVWIPSLAQQFGDEWIRFDQPYYKIRVNNDGLYKVSYELINASISDPRFLQANKLQLWHRGHQLTISMHAGPVLAPGDFFVFYGKKADGKQDSLLYHPATNLYNPYVSIYSDTSSYFLTVSENGPWRRADTLLAKDYSDPNNTFYAEKIKSYFDDFWEGGYTDPLVTHFQPGETWTKNSEYKSSFTENVSMESYVPGSPTYLEMVISDQENLGFNPKIYLGNGSSKLFLGDVSDPINTPYGAARANYTLPDDLNTFLNNGSLPVFVDHQNQGIVSLIYSKITYPRSAIISATAKGYFWTENALAVQKGNTSYQYIVEKNDSTWQWLKDSVSAEISYLPKFPSFTKIFYSSNNDSISFLTPVTFKQYSVSDSIYLILTHKNLLTSASKYAAYRHSPEGGNYDTVTAEIQQVYDQYSYGEKSPLAVRRLLNRYKSQNLNSPDHFFIIGSGMSLNTDEMKDHRADPRKKGDEQDLVISAGVPGGDFTFSIGLDGTNVGNSYNVLKFHYPTVSTGRLSARADSVVEGYLEKTKEHEAVSPLEPWRKNVLHLSGGFDSRQSVEYNRTMAQRLQAYMNGFKSIIEQPYFGANVSTIGRSSSSTTEILDLSEQVNNGISLITFLGHASEDKTDVFVGYMSDPKRAFAYNNKGKYPMLFLNGCVSGNTFYQNAEQSSLMLDWILTKNRGAILAYGSAGDVYVSNLKWNIENTYISAFLDSTNFTSAIGVQLRNAQKRYYETFARADVYDYSMQENFTLQGDPAIHLNPKLKAEYEALCERARLVSTEGKITTLTDSFELAIPVRNRGLFTKQKFNISVKRIYANNTKSIQYPLQSFSPVAELDTLYFKIKGALTDAVGLNTFEITIDPTNEVPESDKSNNFCTFASYISGTSLTCLYPQKYSIVSKQPITFTAQSSTLTDKEREFYFEIDTNYLFKSAFRKTFVVKGTYLPTLENISLLPELASNDSIVYYWRVRYVQPVANEDSAFSQSSFIYIGGSPPGWSQSEYPQFFEDATRAIKLDSSTGKWGLEKLFANLRVTSAGVDAPENGYASTIYFNNIPMVYQKLCYFRGLYLLTLSPIDFKARWVSPVDGDYLYACDAYQSPLVTRFADDERPDPNSQFNFRPNQVFDVLKNKVEDGEIIVLMSVLGTHFPFPDSLNQVLQDLYGASPHIDTLKKGSPYILIGRKGYGKIAEKIPTSTEPLKEVLSLDTTLTSLGQSGFVYSTLIGPATEWGNFFRKYAKATADSIRFDIKGIDSSGKETLLLPNVKDDNYSLSPFIDASKYPFLRLNAFLESNATITPQLLRWQVIYRGVPEGAIVLNSSSSQDYATFTTEEGDSTKPLTFFFKNISTEAFKPHLVVRYKVSNASKSFVRYDTLKTSLQPDSSWKVTFRLNSTGWTGNNNLEVFFNPLPGQREESLDNNRYSLNFNVNGDKIHPVLEVAFDGVRLMNGDIVVPSPTISIALLDNNKYMLRKDTTGMVVELARPCGQPTCPFERVYLGGNDIEYYPAGPNNRFELKYRPKQLPDGKYTLRVQARDVAGNLSGVKPYIIQFEVINEVAVTNFLPYPNPFSSKMWFVYTLTGDLPDQVRIQILTITGKVVKTIFMDELGPLRIGTHRTDFVWDGTDDYGDQLANGLYLYKVNVRKGGEELKHRDNVNDNLFKNGYGKLYILR